MADNSHDEFLKAMGAYVPPPTVEYEYRAYYNPHTKRVIKKTIEDGPGDYIVITKEEYDAMAHDPYKVKDGALVKLPLDMIPDNMLFLDSTGEYRTTKDNNLFLVDNTYSAPVDTWKKND